jgi:hypothetical protein
LNSSGLHEQADAEPKPKTRDVSHWFVEPTDMVGLGDAADDHSYKRDRESPGC